MRAARRSSSRAGHDAPGNTMEALAVRGGAARCCRSRRVPPRARSKEGRSMTIVPRRLLVAALLIGALARRPAAAVEPASFAYGDDVVVSVAALPVTGAHATYTG